MSLLGGAAVVVALCRMCQSCLCAFLARTRVAASRRRPAGAIPARTGKAATGVGFRHPVMIRRALFIATSTLLACGLLHQTGAQYSAAEKTRAWVDIRSVLAEAPQVVPARRRIRATLDVTLALTSSRCCLKVSVRSSRTPRYLGACWTTRRLLSTRTSSSLLPLWYLDGMPLRLSFRC